MNSFPVNVGNSYRHPSGRRPKRQAPRPDAATALGTNIALPRSAPRQPRHEDYAC